MMYASNVMYASNEMYASKVLYASNVMYISNVMYASNGVPSQLRLAWQLGRRLRVCDACRCIHGGVEKQNAVASSSVQVASLVHSYLQAAGKSSPRQTRRKTQGQ